MQAEKSIYKPIETTQTLNSITETCGLCSPEGVHIIRTTMIMDIEADKPYVASVSETTMFIKGMTLVKDTDNGQERYKLKRVCEYF